MIQYLDPEYYIEDDNVYYRDDNEVIDFIFGAPQVVNVVLGLRRYGKTCFLKKIERKCPKMGWSASFHSALTKFADFTSMLNKTVNEYLMDSEDEGDLKHIILIDDLMALDKTFEKIETDEQKDSFEKKLGATIEFVFKEALKSDGRMKIVLAEPTSFFQWLENSDVAKKLPENARRALAMNKFPKILKALKPEEASDLLSAVQKLDKYRPLIPGVTEELVNQVCRETGGNPWLLAHAQSNIRLNNDLLAPTENGGAGDNLIESIKNTVRVERNEELFKTIYGSLSLEEQFILRFLADQERNACRNRQDIRVYLQGITGNPWRPEALAITRRMFEMGLIDVNSNNSLPQNIRSLFIKNHIMQLFCDDPLINTQDIKLRDIWRNLLKHNPFKPPKAGIIHQISDVFFSNDGPSRSWDAYIKYLRSLSAEERPHLIVLCGNLLSAPINEFNLCSQLRKVNEAVDELISYRDSDNRQLLQPAIYGAYDVEDVSPQQIIFVPGIYDRVWNRYRCECEDELKNGLERIVGNLNRPMYFQIPNFLIVPFDSASFNDINERDQGIASQLALTRDNLSRSFDNCMNHMRAANNLNCSPALLFYKNPGGDDNGLDHDFGYLSDRTVKRALDGIDKDMITRRPLKIAISHHRPHRHQLKNELEFIGNLKFRELLVDKGFEFLLHGHSPLQTCLSETMSKWSEDPNPFHMVGSGSFWPTTISFNDNAQNGEINRTIINAPPTFNVIKVENLNPEDTTAPATKYKVEIHFAHIDEQQKVRTSNLPTTLWIEGR